MSGIVSLGKARKAKARALARAKAKENRLAFGRTKAEKASERLKSDAAARRLDGVRREPSDGEA